MAKLIKEEADLSILNKEVKVSMTVEEIIYITCLLARSSTSQIEDALKACSTEYDEQIYKLIEAIIEKCDGNYTMDAYKEYKKLMFDSLK